MVKSSPFTFLTTVKLGIRQSATEYHDALKAGEKNVGLSAKELIDKMPIATTEVSFELVTATKRDLVLAMDRGTSEEIFKLWPEVSICPAEIGAALRLQYPYPNQPEDETLVIAMEPITCSDGYPTVFAISSRGSVPWLYGYRSRVDELWASGENLVFVRRKTETSGTQELDELHRLRFHRLGFDG